jgi:putative ABC transport system substrate-binding protein
MMADVVGSHGSTSTHRRGHIVASARISLGIVILIGAMLVPSAGSGQATKRAYRVGVLSNGFSTAGPTYKGLRAGLEAAGLVEGRDVVLDAHFTLGGEVPPAKLAAALVSRNPDVIFTAGEAETKAANAAAPRVPIVFTHLSDPVAAGLVASLARPGSRLTGVTDLHADLVPKRLELARELLPGLRRVLMVYDVQDPASVAGARRAQEIAPQLKINLTARGVRTEQEAIRELKASGAGDMILAPASNNLNINALVLNLNLYVVAPAIFPSSFWVQGGGVASYGIDFSAQGAQAARLVARILRGARPEDLPVEVGNKIELTINRKTAQAFGLAIPTSLQMRVDRIFEGIGE